MQKFEENELRNMARSLNFKYQYSDAEAFLIDLNAIIDEILIAMKMNVESSSCFFGAFSRGDLINEIEFINIAVILKSQEIYLQTQEIEKYHSKKKRSKNSTLEEFKMLLVMMIQKYFNFKVNIKLTQNAIIIESFKYINMNFKIFVFTQSFKSDTLLAISSSDLRLLQFNLNQYAINFAKKDKETSGNYSKICNIFKCIAIDNGLPADVLLIETILYNLPNELFVGYINEQIFKILNEYKFIQKYDFDSIGNNLKLSSDRFIIGDNYLKTLQLFNKIANIFR